MVGQVPIVVGGRGSEQGAGRVRSGTAREEAEGFPISLATRARIRGLSFGGRPRPSRAPGTLLHGLSGLERPEGGSPPPLIPSSPLPSDSAPPSVQTDGGPQTPPRSVSPRLRVDARIATPVHACQHVSNPRSGQHRGRARAPHRFRQESGDKRGGPRDFQITAAVDRRTREPSDDGGQDGRARPCRVRPCRARSCRARSCRARSRRVRSWCVRSWRVRSWRVRSWRVRSWRVRSWRRGTRPRSRASSCGSWLRRTES